MSELHHAPSAEMPGWCQACCTRWPCDYEDWRVEATEQRARADRLSVSVEELRARLYVITDDYNHGPTMNCQLCGSCVETDEDEETHDPACPLALPPDARGAEILGAGDELAAAISEAHLSIPDYDFTRIMQALGRYRALGRAWEGQG